MKNERLTAANILALRCPEQLDRKFYPDAKVPGLALCVLRSGERRWYIKKKRGGASIRVMLGDARVLTLA